MLKTLPPQGSKDWSSSTAAFYSVLNTGSISHETGDSSKWAICAKDRNACVEHTQQQAHTCKVWKQEINRVQRIELSVVHVVHPKPPTKLRSHLKEIYVTICSEDQQQFLLELKLEICWQHTKKNPHIFTEASWYTPWAQWARASSSSASHLPAWGSSSRSTLTAPRHTGQCHTPNKKSANGVPHGWWSTATVPCLCHGRKALPNNGGGFGCCPAARLPHSTKSTKSSLATRLAGQNCGQPPKAWVRNINCLN